MGSLLSRCSRVTQSDIGFSGESLSTEPHSHIFSSAQDTLLIVHQSPQRGLQPMYDVQSCVDPWASPERARQGHIQMQMKVQVQMAEASSTLSTSRAKRSLMDQELNDAASNATMETQEPEYCRMEVDEGLLLSHIQGTSSQSLPSSSHSPPNKPFKRLPLRRDGNTRAGCGLQKTQSLPASMFRMDAEF